MKKPQRGLAAAAVAGRRVQWLADLFQLGVKFVSGLVRMGI